MNYKSKHSSGGNPQVLTNNTNLTHKINPYMHRGAILS